jgi:hypothetical protein
MLDRLLAYNDSLPPSSRPLTRFHSKAAPSISAHAYLTRITTFTNVDPCILLILLYYIDKLSPDYLTINSLTVHRFLIAAICCGSKALSDSFATNSRYAKVGGVELIEMNALEREFLIAIDWRLAVSVFCVVCRARCRHADSYPVFLGRRRVDLRSAARPVLA